MAGKRIAMSTVDWAKLAERVTADQMPKFLAFRARSDGYLRRMLANPENPPKIDWDHYKKNVPIPGMVDTFKKQYESMAIPYPNDTLSSELDAQEKSVMAEIEQFKSKSNSLISQYKSEIAKLNAMLPYEQMTLEEFYEAHPDQSIDALNKPTLWPHTPDEQPGYKAEGEQPPQH